jgi:peptidoglycan/xylan/chitin deacetylase (PgdA/CDA1 family)
MRVVQTVPFGPEYPHRVCLRAQGRRLGADTPRAFRASSAKPGHSCLVTKPVRPVGRRTVLSAGVLAVGGGALAACAVTPAPPAPATPAGATTATLPATTTATTPATSATTTATGTTTATATSVPGILTTPGPDIASGPEGSAAVALTFHGAGSPALAAAVLAIARSAGAHLTVFAVGQWLAANPALGRDIVAAGHDLGNHTWSHPEMTTLDAATARREIEQGAGAVAGVVGQAGALFRPSGTATSTATIRSAASASGYARCVSYDVDSLDYTDPGAAAVRTRTLAGVKAGSIVSLHLGHQDTVDALPGILQGLADKGLTPVTLTQLLAGAS